MGSAEMQMKHTLPYKNGQALSYAEYGSSTGYPILIQHGLIATITDSFLFERLIRLGTRLICMARPGYGASSPYSMSNIAEWGEIAAVLVDALGLAQFDILGMSSGAPYSYAIGHQFPDRARNIFIFSGTPALFDDQVLAYWPWPVDKNAGLAQLQKLAFELFFSQLSPENLEQQAVTDSRMHDCFGIALDLKLRCLDWGFPLSAVQQSVWMRHSRIDNLAAAEITAKMLPNCRLEVRENDAHFSPELLDDFILTSMEPWYS